MTVVDGIPCTTVARTTFDLAKAVRRRGVERLLDQAVAMNVFNYLAFEDQLERNPSRPEARLLRSVLAEHNAGSTLTESEFEELFLARVRAAGFPRPETQQYLELPDGGPALRADFLWRAQRMVVETDSLKYHRTRASMDRDTTRDQRLVVHNWWPFRTTWSQVQFRWESVEPRLRTMLAM